MSKPTMNTPLINPVSIGKTAITNKTPSDLRAAVHALAEAAFHRHLISGYGDSEYPDEYQIVHEGKPKHLPLNRAHAFLTRLMQRSNG